VRRAHANAERGWPSCFGADRPLACNARAGACCDLSMAWHLGTLPWHRLIGAVKVSRPNRLCAPGALLPARRVLAEARSCALSCSCILTTAHVVNHIECVCFWAMQSDSSCTGQAFSMVLNSCMLSSQAPVLVVQVGPLGAPCSCAVLIDCGEGTLPALRRCIGAQAAQAAVDSLAAVFVSHKHADHCLGLPAVLQARPQRMRLLLLAVPAAVQTWLQEAYAHLVARAHFVHCAAFAGGHFAAAHARREAGVPAGPGKGGSCSAVAAFQAAGFTAWVCPRVRHCHDAFGLVLQHRQGWKFVFSGDTAPCDALLTHGRGATLLVHEATFGDDRTADAAAKRHSTLSQALAAADAMGAWRVLLTHFSQRYGRHAPDLWAGDGVAGRAAAPAARERAGLAFDGMVVPFVALHGLPAVTRAMMGFLTQHCCDAAEAEWERRV
jgi:ribonuclease BN (tRNA processing enzyme)